MSEKDIYIKLTETQASTLLRIAETHPDASKWGAKGTRNAVMAEIRSALTAEVREHDGDWAEWSTSLTDQQIATPDDVRANFGLMPKNEDLGNALNDAAAGQTGESTEEAEERETPKLDELVSETPAWDYTGKDAEADLTAEEQREDVISDEPLGSAHDGDSETEGDESNEDTNEDDSNNS